MAYTTVDDPTIYFNTKLYTGNGSTQSITGVNFQPNFTWIKGRTAAEYDHQLYDSVRGATKAVASNSGDAESTASTSLTSFNSDGFSLGAFARTNSSGNNKASWNWKAGTTSGIATNGSTNITPSGYSFNQTAGFSAIAYTGTAVDGAYLPHGLGKAPELLLLKGRSLAESWQVYSAPTGNQGRGHLDNTDAFDTSRGEWYSNTPDSVNMRISNDSHVNSSGATYIAYFFTSIKGYSKIGSYKGNENADGPYTHTGFKPSFVIIKNVTQNGDRWIIHDDKRDPINGCNHRLFPDANIAESTSTTSLDFTSNGFKQRTDAGTSNTNGQTYIYMAFAESPFVSSSGIPTTARV